MDLDMKKKYFEYAEEYILPNAADYSVMVKGLPQDVTLSEIQKFIEDKLLYSGAPGTSVLKIYVIYNLRAYNTLYANKRSLVEQIAVLEQ